MHEAHAYPCLYSTTQKLNAIKKNKAQQWLVSHYMRMSTVSSKEHWVSGPTKNKAQHRCVSPHEDVHRLLKGALGERAIAIAVDAMACDGHQVTPSRHDVTQDCKVPVCVVYL
jgi:hypothetical protein